MLQVTDRMRLIAFLARLTAEQAAQKNQRCAMKVFNALTAEQAAQKVQMPKGVWVQQLTAEQAAQKLNL